MISNNCMFFLFPLPEHDIKTVSGTSTDEDSYCFFSDHLFSRPFSRNQKHCIFQCGKYDVECILQMEILRSKK